MIKCLGNVLPEYEHRPEQEEMARHVEDAFTNHRTALIEAGTGTGKSMAYLIPAILSDQITVISTHTINLQEQLLEKDIPLAIKALDVELKAVLVKGMNNYVCLRRQEDESDVIWAEKDACNHVHCPHYKECHFFRARREIEDAKLLIVNHHLLLSDLALKEKGENGILPNYQQLIIDEAHHLEDVATNVWATKLSRAELVHLLGRSETLDLLAQKRELVLKTNEVFYKFGDLCPEGSVRIREALGGTDELTDDIKRYAASLRGIEDLDLKAIVGRLDDFASNLTAFANDAPSPEAVRWIERTTINVRLITAHLDVSSLLKERIFSAIPSIVLTSATLTTGRSFSYLKKRLGIEGELIEAIYDSPFDFDSQGLFLVPTDLPAPTDPSFNKQAADAILQTINASRGNAFVLFTSFQMMHKCKELIESKLDYPLLTQGDEDRASLLATFKETDQGVLFGTSSFWEGVDVAGEALRCVILAKLPFKVPTEPLIQARNEALTEQGESPFSAYALPQAIMKFKQGVGRLIRNSADRGCVVCLDSRLTSKPYGRLFLRSIPPFRQHFAPLSDLTSQVQAFLSK